MSLQVGELNVAGRAHYASGDKFDDGMRCATCGRDSDRH